MLINLGEKPVMVQWADRRIARQKKKEGKWLDHCALIRGAMGKQDRNWFPRFTHDIVMALYSLAKDGKVSCALVAIEP